MNSEWKMQTLSDVCVKITDGAHQSPQSTENGKPMASVKDLTPFGITINTCRLISSADFEDLKRQGCSPMPGDVLIAKDGNSALDTVCVFSGETDVVLLSSVAILRPKVSTDPYFLRYYLDTPSVRELLKGGYLSGSAIPRVVLRDFKLAPIPTPPFEEQFKIGRILKALDDKIELNQKMNETLEDIAKAIFKSWFVDFDPVRAKAEGRPTGLPAEISDLFPDAFEDSEIGEIPAGWELKELSHALSLDSGFAYKGNLKGEGSRYLMTMGCVSQTSRCEEKGIHKYGGDFKGKSLVNPGDICISSHDVTQAREHLGAPFIVPDTVQGVSTAAATNTFIVRATGTLPSEFIFQTMKTQRFRNEMIACAKGSVILHISKGAVTNYQYAHPCAELIDKFAFIMVPIVQRLDCASAENRILSELRDTLLPKLISGELRIPDAEKFLEEAGI